jgi:hypothetical protein
MKRFFVALVLSISTLTMLPLQANAASPWLWSRSGWVTTRTCPSVNCPVVAWVPNGTKFMMIRYTDNQWACGNYCSARWFRGITFNNGRDVWTHSSYVQNQVWVPSW